MSCNEMSLSATIRVKTNY